MLRIDLAVEREVVIASSRILLSVWRSVARWRQCSCYIGFVEEFDDLEVIVKKTGIESILFQFSNPSKNLLVNHQSTVVSFDEEAREDQLTLDYPPANIHHSCLPIVLSISSIQRRFQD